MTDNDIIKALECCSKAKLNDDCRKLKCPFFDAAIDMCGVLNSEQVLIANALDLINRLIAEIKKLTSGKCVYLSDDETTEYCVEGPCPNYKTVAQIKAEAITEFAERLDLRVEGIPWCECKPVQNAIDELAKEMKEGVNNA